MRHRIFSVPPNETKRIREVPLMVEYNKGGAAAPPPRTISDHPDLWRAGNGTLTQQASDGTPATRGTRRDESAATPAPAPPAEGSDIARALSLRRGRRRVRTPSSRVGAGLRRAASRALARHDGRRLADLRAERLALGEPGGALALLDLPAQQSEAMSCSGG